MELRLVFGAAQLPIPTEQVLFQYHPKFRIRFACSIYYSNHATGLDCTGRAVVRPFIIVHVRVALSVYVYAIRLAHFHSACSIPPQ